MTDQILNFGVTEASIARDETDGHAEEVRLSGFTVLDSGLSPVEVTHLRDGIEAVIARQTEEVGGHDVMARLDEANTGRAMLAYDDRFIELVRNGPLLALMERLLGRYFVLNQQNAIVVQPDDVHHQIRFHRDLPYQHFVSSRPLALNALFCADPFTLDNGATFVIPGSHKHEPFPDEAVVRRLQRQVTVPAGGFLVLDAMTYHRAGINRSAHPRRAINHVFTLPFIRQQIDLPALLKGRYADDPLLSRLFGYGLEVPVSVRDWRLARLKRL